MAATANRAGKTEEKKAYLTLKQAAAISGHSYASLRREIENGRLPAFRAGRKYFIDPAVLAASPAQPPGYTIAQVMEILPLSYAFIIELIHSGRLSAYKQGRRYIIPPASLEAFLQEAEVRS